MEQYPVRFDLGDRGHLRSVEFRGVMGQLNVLPPDYLQYCGKPGTWEPQWMMGGWQAHTCIGWEQWLPWLVFVLLLFVIVGLYLRSK